MAEETREEKLARIARLAQAAQESRARLEQTRTPQRPPPSGGAKTPPPPRGPNNGEKSDLDATFALFLSAFVVLCATLFSFVVIPTIGPPSIFRAISPLMLFIALCGGWYLMYRGFKSFRTFTDSIPHVNRFEAFTFWGLLLVTCISTMIQLLEYLGSNRIFQLFIGWAGTGSPNFVAPGAVIGLAIFAFIFPLTWPTFHYEVAEATATVLVDFYREEGEDEKYTSVPTGEGLKRWPQYVRRDIPVEIRNFKVSVSLDTRAGPKLNATVQGSYKINAQEAEQFVLVDQKKEVIENDIGEFVKNRLQPEVIDKDPDTDFNKATIEDLNNKVIEKFQGVAQMKAGKRPVTIETSDTPLEKLYAIIMLTMSVTIDQSKEYQPIRQIRRTAEQFKDLPTDAVEQALVANDKKTGDNVRVSGNTPEDRAVASQIAAARGLGRTVRGDQGKGKKKGGE